MACLPSPQTQASQRGASSMLVIAVLVLLGSLTVYVAGLVSSVNNGLAMEVNLTRASQAAESGLDWGRYRVKVNNTCNASQSIAMPASLSPYTVTVLCTRNNSTDGTIPRIQYRITATACNLPLAGNCPNNTSISPGPDYVEWQVTALVDYP